MKIRTDYVTNSSSSSFICEICGHSEFGYDMTYNEAGMFCCVNGHELCLEHMLDVPREKMTECILENSDEYTAEELKIYSEDDLIEILDGIFDEFPEIFCPICQFEEYSKNDMANYLHTKYGVEKNEVLDHLKEKNKRRKVVRNYEYNDYVAEKFGLNLDEVFASWKEEFKEYEKFKEYLKNKWFFC